MVRIPVSAKAYPSSDFEIPGTLEKEMDHSRERINAREASP
jgi:hypothetical protein